MSAVTADSWRSARYRWRLAAIPPIAWLVVGYLIFLAPHAHRYIKHHPDERHYTDAAVRMVQSGDYLTPQTRAANCDSRSQY